MFLITRIKCFIIFLFNVIKISDDSWGLPLAIAANLHVPYRIEIGTDHLTTVNIEDDQHKGMIHFESFCRSI